MYTETTDVSIHTWHGVLLFIDRRYLYRVASTVSMWPFNTDGCEVNLNRHSSETESISGISGPIGKANKANNTRLCKQK